MKTYIESFEKFGYFLLRNVISPSLLTSLRYQIDSAIHDDKIKGHTRGNYSYLLQNKGACFVELLELSPLQDYVDAILGDTCILHSYNSISLMPGVENKMCLKSTMITILMIMMVLNKAHKSE